MVRSCHGGRVRLARFTLSPIGGRGRGGSTSRICCGAPTGRTGRSGRRRSRTSRICPTELIELVRAGLRGEPVGVRADAFEIERSLPAGHVNAALAMARRLELAKAAGSLAVAGAGSVLAMICQRVIARRRSSGRSARFGQSTLASELGVDGRRRGRSVRGDGLAVGAPGADRGSPRAPAPGGRGAGALRRVLVATSRGGAARWRRWATRATASAARRRSSTGCCATGRAGRSRSRCSRGELHDDKTLPAQIAKLKDRFGLSRVVVVV